MLDAAMLARVSSCYAAAATVTTNKDLPFGGKDIIIIGDLLQLPPISEFRSVKPLYDDMVANALQQNSSRFNEDKRLTDGLTLLEKFNKFELKKQMRSKDKRHTKHIESLRTERQAKPVGVGVEADGIAVCGGVSSCAWVCLGVWACLSDGVTGCVWESLCECVRVCLGVSAYVWVRVGLFGYVVGLKCFWSCLIVNVIYMCVGNPTACTALTRCSTKQRGYAVL